MAQTGFTPIQIYRSSTASAAPTSGNLVAGELAINTADGKLFYLDNLNAVQVIGWKLVPVSAGGTGTTTSTGTGSVVLSDSPTFTTAITSTGALQLTGSATVNQNIGTAQTSGTLNIGGTAATAALNLGQSTSTQGINIGGTGTGTIIIGRSAAAQTISIADGTNNNALKTVNIAYYGSNTGTRKVNIASNNIVFNGPDTTIINIGSNNAVGQCQVNMNSTFNQTILTVFDLYNNVTSFAGMRAFVNDASGPLTPVFGQIVNSGGGMTVPVYFDGTDWRVG